MKRVFFNEHKTLKFLFKQSKEDFFVEEINSTRFKGKGNFLILKIKKEDMTTFSLINLLSKILGVPTNMIGYAGLKDKNATTIQYISIPKNRQKDLEKLSAKRVEILGSWLHNEKLSIGDLDGNKFSINLKKVTYKDMAILEKKIEEIKENGIPNYFGYQRFGKDDSNFEKSKDVIYGERLIKDKKMEKIMVSAYQSSFFNEWLKFRVEDAISKKLSKIEVIDGDVMMDISSKKTFSSKNLEQIKADYEKKLLVPTGLLPGRNVYRAFAKAREIEEKFDDLYVYFKGDRRAAWIYPQELQYNYNKETSELNISFFLPKGSYATVLIENLANKNFG